MNPFLACTTRPKRRTPSQSCLIHRDLETAMLHARSIDKPVAWAPPQPFSFMGREGDALMIHTDGLCRRVKLWNRKPANGSGISPRLRPENQGPRPQHPRQRRMKTLRSPLVLPPPSTKTFGRKLARLLATARKSRP